MEAIVLAGGFGTRLRAAVPDLPKPLAPVAGRPFLAILLDQLIASGIDHVVLSVGYLHDKIMAAFGDSYGGARISYFVEQEPLGTGGAIRAALSRCATDHVLAMNGDSFSSFDLPGLVSLLSPAQFAMGLVSMEECTRYGRVLVTDGTVTGFQEKGVAGAGLINAGVYALARTVFDPYDLPEKFSFETDFMMPFVSDLRPPFQIGDGLFIDIGVPEDFARAQTVFAA
jgi:D-glycero-alpha-D-manno-heptose 1-phosphate guanylyltransferase